MFSCQSSLRAVKFLSKHFFVDHSWHVVRMDLKEYAAACAVAVFFSAQWQVWSPNSLEIAWNYCWWKRLISFFNIQKMLQTIDVDVVNSKSWPRSPQNLTCISGSLSTVDPLLHRWATGNVGPTTSGRRTSSMPNTTRRRSAFPSWWSSPVALPSAGI